MKSFDIKTKIYFGDNAMDRVRELPYKRIMIVTDKFFSGSSLLRIVTQPLSESNKEFRIFNDVVPDPPIDKIVVGVKAVLEYKPDCIDCDSYDQRDWFGSHVFFSDYRSDSSYKISASF